MYRGILIIFFFCTGNIFSQNLSFIKEKIEMTIQNDSVFTISGKYYFLNKNDKKFISSFYYPFVIDSNNRYPDSILILDGNNHRVSYTKNENGIFFPIKSLQKDTSVFTAFYRQKTLKRRAEYILTTTQNWNVPLQKAEYIVKLPKSLILKSISLQPDSIKNYSSYKIIFIAKENFLPMVNLFVEWGKE
ncbi:MAG: hypothetical protein P8Z35_13490 [Ignavibacteriaceae bacterium]